jgi:hypothetical protein
VVKGQKVYVVFFLRGLADIVVWGTAAGLIIGLSAGLIRSIIRGRRGMQIDLNDRRPHRMRVPTERL